MTDIRRRLVELPRGLGEISGGGARPARVRYSLRVAQESMFLGAAGVEAIPVRVKISGQLTVLDGPPSRDPSRPRRPTPIELYRSKRAGGTGRLAIDRVHTLHMQDGRQFDFVPSEIDRTSSTVRIAQVSADLAFVRLRSTA